MSRPRLPIDWSTQPLGQEPDGVIAERVGASRGTVAYWRKKAGIPAFQQERPTVTNWDAQPLGKVPDAEIARRLGVAPTSVRAQREKRKIPPFEPPQVDWDAQPFGEVSDAEIAIRTGCSKNTVGAQRRKRGILAYRSSSVGRRDAARRAKRAAITRYHGDSDPDLLDDLTEEGRRDYLEPHEAAGLLGGGVDW